MLFLSSMFNAERLFEGSMYLFHMLCNQRFYVILLSYTDARLVDQLLISQNENLVMMYSSKFAFCQLNDFT